MFLDEAGALCECDVDVMWCEREDRLLRASRCDRHIRQQLEAMAGC